MDLLDALLGEHGLFYAMFEHMEQERPSSLETLKAHARILDAALLSHAHLEESLLYPALEELIGPMGPLTVMRHEHEAIESELRRISSLGDADQARAALIRLLSVTRDHFGKEEEILFPMARQHVPQETLRQLGQQWSLRRQVGVSAASVG